MEFFERFILIRHNRSGERDFQVFNGKKRTVMLKLIGGILVAGSGVGLAVNMITEIRQHLLRLYEIRQLLINISGEAALTSDGAYFESTDADERCGVAKSMRTDC